MLKILKKIREIRKRCGVDSKNCVKKIDLKNIFGKSEERRENKFEEIRKKMWKGLRTCESSGSKSDVVFRSQYCSEYCETLSYRLELLLVLKLELEIRKLRGVLGMSGYVLKSSGSKSDVVFRSQYCSEYCETLSYRLELLGVLGMSGYVLSIT
ncbi:Hypothetical predicted protein [Octopus vulgaris]|uniref:Uncharacterized protein n=1 Tax=Octopus vulgaris TaxID=6645 RepID=A0AA36FPL2_OCTVU|nr:Hypothetical predicted protein [Octopus vulgaris]